MTCDACCTCRHMVVQPGTIVLHCVLCKSNARAAKMWSLSFKLISAEQSSIGTSPSVQL